MKTLLQKLREPASLVQRQAAVDDVLETHSDCALIGLSMAQCNLSGLSLARLKMRKLDFRDSSCNRATFPMLADCILDGVEATYSQFPRLVRCSLKGAALTGSSFGARITECDFSDAVLQFARFGQNLTAITRYYRGNLFTGTDLCGIDGCGAYFSRASFRGARLSEARLSRANLSGSDFENADLSRSNLVRAKLSGAKLVDAQLHGCIVTPTQAQELRRRFSMSESDFDVFARSAGPCTTQLQRELDGVSEYNLEWRLRDIGALRSEKLFVWKDDVVAKSAGASSFGSNREYLRTYPWGGAKPLLRVLSDMATDYANWEVDSQTVRVEVAESASATRVIELLHGMLRELFVVT